MNSRLCRSRVNNRIVWALRAVTAIAFLISTAPRLKAATATVTWDANTEPNLAGYIVAYGTQSGTYPTRIDVRNVTTWQLNLTGPQRYYVVVQAYNTSAQLSNWSSPEQIVDIPGPLAPIIGGLSPTSGSAGTSVTIAGLNFLPLQGLSSVRFNGTIATPTSWSATGIVVPVPSGATTGAVVVTVAGVVSNGVNFTVTSSAPSVTSLSPNSGTVGTTVTIAGTNFGTMQGASTVRFNGIAATPTSWSATSIVVPVPSGATTGPVVVTVNSAASNGVTFTVNASTLPAPWTTQDVGNPAVSGGGAYASGTFSVSGAGVDIWGTNDQFRFVFQPLDGDGEIVARVASLLNTDPWAKAGVMIREDLTGDARNVVAQATVGNGMVFQRRDMRGGLSTSIKGFTGVAPQWIRLVRSGNTFTGYYSVTGTAWTLMGANTVSMASRVYVGLSLTSHNPSVAASATFTNVTVSAAGSTPNQAPTLTQPLNQTSAEGATVSVQLVASDPDGHPLTYAATGLPASLGVNPTTGVISGTLTFTSAGTYNVTATASDGALTNSKVFPWTVTDVGQGPSISSLLPASGAVGTSVTIAGTNFGTTQGTSTVRFNGTTAMPTSWSATSIVVPVPSGATTGSVVVTINSAVSNGVTFTVNSSSSLPAPWTSQDVGNPAVSGQATFASGTFSVSGAGVDIWGTSDQFRFVFQPLNGDGEIVARVASLQNTDQWAKAGVMIREDLTGDARNVVTEATVANGMVFQRRDTRGALSTSVKGFGGVAPQWIRLVRSGNTFNGYYSVTGTAWTLMGSSTVSMASQVYVGLSLTSHNPSVATSAAFTDVTVNGTVARLASSEATVDTGSAIPTTAQVEPDHASTEQETILASAVNALAISDYDGDGRSDIAAYRPSTGEWRVLSSRGNYTNGIVRQWGTATDVPVLGDYDGDRKADMAYYRPSTGTWSILKSSTNYTTNLDVWLGLDGDVPVPGDYDGDGITDVAVYSPATGQWRVLKSTTNYVTEIVALWGTAGDIPVPGDYDGDGKTDLAVYRPSTGQWKIAQSSTEYATNVTVVLGNGTGIPVPADYDGDHVTDVAVFQPATGTWQVRTASGSDFKTTVAGTLGAKTDVPVPGDYDGDGRADIATFQSGIWQILYSSAGYSSGVKVSWGSATDVPLPRRP